MLAPESQKPRYEAPILSTESSTSDESVHSVKRIGTSDGSCFTSWTPNWRLKSAENRENIDVDFGIVCVTFLFVFGCFVASIWDHFWLLWGSKMALTAKRENL